MKSDTLYIDFFTDEVSRGSTSAMNTSDAHFVVSNYNTDPTQLLKFCKSFTLYDQSDDLDVRSIVKQKFPEALIVSNPGHSLRNYFDWIADNYETMPSLVALLKSNLVGRHIDREYWLRVYGNAHYTHLWHDPAFRPTEDVNGRLTESQFFELNNSWYADSRTHRFFQSCNELISFVYRDPVLPKYLCFAPGANYIVSASQLRKFPPDFWRGLSYLVSYTHFPAEAYFVERILHLLFTSDQEIQSQVLTLEDFMEALLEIPDQSGFRAPKVSVQDRVRGQLVSWLRVNP